MGLSRDRREPKPEETAEAKVGEWSVENELTKVESWRIDILMSSGYPVALAQRIAMSSVDLHLACDMLAQGCSPDTAAEILL